MSKENAVCVRGGIAKGFGGAGAIVALGELGITFGYRCGSSSGAMVAALSAADYDLRKCTNEISELNFMSDICGNILSNLRNRSIASEELLRRAIGKFFDKDIRIEELPLIVFVSDSETKKRVILRRGNLTNALMASISWSVIFPKVVINDTVYGDGDLDRSWPVEELVKYSLVGIGREGGGQLVGSEGLAALILYPTRGNRFQFGSIQGDFERAHKTVLENRDQLSSLLVE